MGRQLPEAEGPSVGASNYCVPPRISSACTCSPVPQGEYLSGVWVLLVLFPSRGGAGLQGKASVTPLSVLNGCVA